MFMYRVSQIKQQRYVVRCTNIYYKFTLFRKRKMLQLS